VDRSRSRISSPTHRSNDPTENDASRQDEDVMPVRRSSVMSLRLASSRSIGILQLFITTG